MTMDREELLSHVAAPAIEWARLLAEREKNSREATDSRERFRMESVAQELRWQWRDQWREEYQQKRDALYDKLHSKYKESLSLSTEVLEQHDAEVGALQAECEKKRLAREHTDEKVASFIKVVFEGQPQGGREPEDARKVV